MDHFAILAGEGVQIPPLSHRQGRGAATAGRGCPGARHPPGSGSRIDTGDARHLAKWFKWFRIGNHSGAGGSPLPPLRGASPTGGG